MIFASQQFSWDPSHIKMSCRCLKDHSESSSRDHFYTSLNKKLFSNAKRFITKGNFTMHCQCIITMQKLLMLLLLLQRSVMHQDLFRICRAKPSWYQISVCSTPSACTRYVCQLAAGVSGPVLLFNLLDQESSCIPAHWARYVVH